MSVAAHAESLPSAFTTALQQAGIPLDHVAVVVQPLDTDKPLISHNADAALNPASVMKLVTSFAALNQLGPNYVWKTDVWAEGPIRDGVLEGDLVIKGYGDPTLTLERMWLLQRELRARGVRHIRGNLVLDLSDFELPASDPGAFDGEPLALYNAAPGALVANFNATTLRLKPDGNVIEIEPDVALPGEHAVFVPPRDTSAIAAAIAHLASDAAGLAQMSTACRHRIARHYSPERLVQEFGALYADLQEDSRKICAA